MKRLIALLAVLAISVAFTGCAGGSDTPKKAEETEKTPTPRTVTVELEENPSTGYTWSYTMDKADILKETGNELIPGDSSEEEVGVSGVRRYTFEAVADGTVKISFEYKQEWEGGNSDRKYSETYEVKDGIPTLTGFSDSTSSQSMDPQEKAEPLYIRIDSIYTKDDALAVQTVYMKPGEDEEDAFEETDEDPVTLTLSPDAKILYSEDQGPQTEQISATDFAEKFEWSDSVYLAVINNGVIESMEFCYLP